jgi:hypothetical protein
VPTSIWKIGYIRFRVRDLIKQAFSPTRLDIAIENGSGLNLGPFRLPVAIDELVDDLAEVSPVRKLRFKHQPAIFFIHVEICGGRTLNVQ